MLACAIVAVVCLAVGYFLIRSELIYWTYDIIGWLGSAILVSLIIWLTGIPILPALAIMIVGWFGGYFFREVAKHTRRYRGDTPR